MLEVDQLVAGRGHRPIARLEYLSLGAGEGALLAGPSGSGKTTLLLALAGLAERVAGRIAIDGADLSTTRQAAFDRFRGQSIGMIFQDIHLVAGLTALENLLLAPFATGARQDHERARSLLDSVGLAACTHQKAETLSRGQAQRVAIARAVLMRPKLILADEPTASLDDESCAAVADLLKAAAAETGAALLVATHDHRLREAFPLAVAAEPVQ